MINNVKINERLYICPIVMLSSNRELVKILNHDNTFNTQKSKKQIATNCVLIGCMINTQAPKTL